MTPSRLPISLSLLVALSGCAPYAASLSRAATAGAVDELADDASATKLSALTSAVAGSATRAAREQALGPETGAALQRVVASAGIALDGELRALGQTLRAELRQSTRLAIDEALSERSMSEVDALRERLVGPPAQADVNALIDGAAPHLSSAVASAIAPLQVDVATIKTEADAEASKWRSIVAWLAASAGALLLLLLVLGWGLWRSHRRVVDALLERRG